MNTGVKGSEGLKFKVVQVELAWVSVLQVRAGYSPEQEYCFRGLSVQGGAGSRNNTRCLYCR